MDERDDDQGEDRSPPEPITERVRIIGAEPAGLAARSADAEPPDAGRQASLPSERATSLFDTGVGDPPARDPGGAALFDVDEAAAGGAWDTWAGPATSSPGPGDRQAGSLVGAASAGSDRPGDTVFSDVELPHWTEPPTGQVPAVLDRRSAEDPGDVPWSSVFDTGPTWREHDHEWDDDDFEPALLADDETRLGVLEDAPIEERRPWEFSDMADPATGDLEATAMVPEVSGDADTAADGWSDTMTAPVGGPDVAAVPGPVAPSAPGETGGPSGPPTGRSSGPDPTEARVLGRSRPRMTTISSSPLRSEGHAGRHPSRRARHRAAEPPRGGRNVPTAIATGVIVAAIGLTCFALGSVASVVLATVVMTLAMAECYAALRAAGRRPATLLGLVGTVAIMVAAYTKGLAALPLVLVLVVMATLVWYLAGVERGPAVEGVAVTLLGFTWIALFGSFAALLLAPSLFPERHGVAFLLGAVVAVVANDVGALTVGGWLGRHQLAPRISPNKTWEGLVGGAVLSVVLSVVITGSVSPWTHAKAALLGVVVAVLAPVGDLCESLVKRDLGLKDMGAALPGHGGVLDRFDALIFVLPATFYLVRVLHLG